MARVFYGIVAPHDCTGPVTRRGAGKGGRALALLGLLAVFAVAIVVVWWSVVR